MRHPVLKKALENIAIFVGVRAMAMGNAVAVRTVEHISVSIRIDGLAMGFAVFQVTLEYPVFFCNAMAERHDEVVVLGCVCGRERGKERGREGEDFWFVYTCSCRNYLHTFYYDIVLCIEVKEGRISSIFSII